MYNSCDFLNHMTFNRGFDDADKAFIVEKIENRYRNEDCMYIELEKCPCCGEEVLQLTIEIDEDLTIELCIVFNEDSAEIYSDEFSLVYDIAQIIAETFDENF